MVRNAVQWEFIHMENELYAQMYHAEQEHWWFAGKRRIVAALLKHYLLQGDTKVRELRVCDIGCGCGMTQVHLETLGFQTIGVDPSQEAIDYCRSRGVQATVGMLPEQLDIEDNTVDAVIMAHVLEHTKDDYASLREAYRVIRSGGVVLSIVPAYPFLWSRRGDELPHHFRRYTRATLRALLESAENSEILFLSYMDSFLFPLTATQRLLWKVRPSGEKDAVYTVPAYGVNRVLRRIFSAESHLLARGISLPFGMSVVGIIRKR